MQPLKLLVIDDSETFRSAAAAYLSARPHLHVVTTVGTAAQGLAYAEDRPLDLVLLDLQMPEMDGLETTRRFKARAADPKVAIISLHDSLETRRQAHLAGADGFVGKADFAARIHAVIASLFPQRSHLSSPPPPSVV